MLSNQKIFSLVDLTSLNEDDTTEHIMNLCTRARRLNFGTVAAICVYPQFVAQVRATVGDEINVATVVNFPHGEDDLEKVSEMTKTAIDNGANEIDVVFPYKAWLRNETQFAENFTQTVAEICHRNNALLKVILETGALNSEQISAIAKVSIQAGADFLKTSTGKIAQGATSEAVELLLHEIKASGKKVGVKVSGGVRDVAVAIGYIEQAIRICGDDFIVPKTFRIGASALIDSL